MQHPEWGDWAFIRERLTVLDKKTLDSFLVTEMAVDTLHLHREVDLEAVLWCLHFGLLTTRVDPGGRVWIRITLKGRAVRLENGRARVAARRLSP